MNDHRGGRRTVVNGGGVPTIAVAITEMRAEAVVAIKAKAPASGKAPAAIDERGMLRAVPPRNSSLEGINHCGRSVAENEDLAMHNDLAWAVLGVDPAAGKLVEDAAKKRGASVGRWLELMLAESRAVAAERASVELASRKREQQLRDLMADMAEALMSAAELLRKDRAPTETNDRGASAADPLQRAAIEMDTSAPNVENIQAWMRRLEDKAPPPSTRPARRGFLRRSA
jgi:hypothetical protein